MRFNPFGDRLRALESNILKYRSYEVLLVVFYVEEIKNFAMRTIQSNDQRKFGEPRISPKTKKKYQKLWDILVSEGVLEQSDRILIEDLIEFRNNSAHSLADLFSDLNTDDVSKFVSQKFSYNHGAAVKAEKVYERLVENMNGNYFLTISTDSYVFRNAESLYKKEMKKLAGKINKLYEERKLEIERLNAEQDRFASEHIHLLKPIHPDNRKGNNQITPIGKATMEKLFDLGYSNLFISYSMKISLRTVNAYQKKLYA
ncbi:hypothetical protein AL552_17835 [Vibrio diabolicus]|uniref:hypothetical protein n=1 Tax=Vibrio diabolicus TaxID=50719 RepID=UPI000CE97BB6|nr:hypothetical protein [Vibrio diabolicus]AVF95463.1 hypothetical protein AL552_17835 [Vibrio diabolicus]